MDTINHILGNFSTLLIILGALLAVIAIAGKIKTKWIEINFSSRSKRLPLSIMAFVFIALASVYAMRPPLTNPPSINDMILQDDGRFEWQWAGQNWIGNLEFERDSSNEIMVRLDINKVFGKDGVVDVMRTLDPGKVKLFSDHIEISNLKVNKNEFDLVPIGLDRFIEGMGKKTSSTSLLSITDLRPVIAFAGAIRYQHLEGGSEGRIVNDGTGDIVLVKYRSGGRF